MIAREHTESVRYKHRSSDSKFCSECLSQNIVTSRDKHAMREDGLGLVSGGIPQGGCQCRGGR